MHSKLGTWALAAAALFTFISPARAQDGCAAGAEALKQLAAGVKAEIAAPKDLKAGGSFQFTWTVPSRFPASSPAYLVLAVPGEARFEVKTDAPPPAADGSVPPSLPGFLALPSAAKSPGGLEFGAGMTRAIIPLHQAGSRLSGTVSVRMFEAGVHAAEAAVVSTGTCGEQKLSQDFGGQFTVAPGTPEIVVQDPYDADVPKRMLVSNSQRYVAQIFDGRYRVYDIATGAKLVDRAGHNPNFSPASRFIAADVGDADGHSFEVIDLVSREVTAKPAGPFIGWVNGDAFIIDGMDQYGALSVTPSLISRPASAAQEEPARGARVAAAQDGLSLQAPGACHACSSWSDAGMMFDLDHGVVAFTGTLTAQTPVYELASGYTACCAKAADVKAVLARDYGIAAYAPQPGWQAAGDRIAFSHIYDAAADPNGKNVQDQTWYKAAIPMRQQLVAHRETDPKAPPEQIASLRLDAVIRGDWREKVRSAGETSQTPSARERLLTDLSGFGVRAAPGAAFEALAFSNSPAPSSGNDERYGANSAQADKIIAARTAPYRQRLLQEVPAIAPHLAQPAAAAQPAKPGQPGKPNQAAKPGKPNQAAAPAKKPALPAPPSFPYDGDLKDAKINLDNHLEGLWRWELSGRPLWLMQLLTIEGSGAFGQGAMFLMDGNKQSATPIINLSKALPGFWDGSYGRTPQQTRLKPQIVLGRYLVLASVISQTIAVYDLQAGQMLTLVKNVPQADLIAEVLLSADARHVIQLNSDGQFFLHDIATGATALSGRSVDGEIILYTPEGYYWSSYEGAHFVQLRFPGLAGLFSFKQFASALDRPEIIKARLAGNAAATPAPKLAPPPALEARLLSAAGANALEDRVLADARSAGGLARLRLYQDGQLVHSQDLKGPEFQGEVAVPHAAHPRFLTALATDANGFVSTPQTLRLKSSPGGTNRLHAVLAGVDSFTDMKLNLKYAKSDARRLAAALTASGKRYYGAQQQTVLLDEGATLAAITGALEKAVTEARAEDTILFSFAGHGVQGSDGLYYLTPSGFSAEDIKGTGLPWSKLAGILGKSKARVVVVLDACHSGLSGSEGLATNDDAVKALLSGAKAPMLVLAASKGRQYSYEDAKWGGGVFTFALAEVMRAGASYDLNRNGVLEVSELYRALKLIAGRETAGQQTPWLARQDLIGDFTLF